MFRTIKAIIAVMSYIGTFVFGWASFIYFIVGILDIIGLTDIIGFDRPIDFYVKTLAITVSGAVISLVVLIIILASNNKCNKAM